jgi:uncharacterized protein
MKNIMMLLLALGFSDLVYGQILTAKQESIIPIAAHLATGDQENLKKALTQGLDAGLSVNEIKEVLVQLYAYTGFPRSLNAINTFENVITVRKLKGINDPEGKAASTVLLNSSKFDYGRDVQTKLTGSTATGAPQRFVPVIDTFLKEHLFADVFSRDVLDFKAREIATISALASMGGVESQLKSHLNVGRNVGLSEAQLRRISFLITTKVGQQQGNTVSMYLDSMFKNILIYY